MNKLLKVLLLSLVVTVGFVACSKKAEDAAKESLTEMKATTIDAAKDAAVVTEAAAKDAAASTEAAVGEAKDKAVDAVQAAKETAAK